MKSTLSSTCLSDCIDVHYSKDLPMFPRSASRWNSPTPQRLLSRASDLPRFARRMAVINHGRFSVELADPAGIYFDFLQDLILVEGVDFLVDASRYVLTVQIGRCFDARVVFESVARCVHQHFHLSESLQLEYDSNVIFDPLAEFSEKSPSVAHQ